MDYPTIDELFRRDPYKLTNDDFEQLVAHYREKRTNFIIAGKAEPKEKPKPTLAELGIL